MKQRLTPQQNEALRALDLCGALSVPTLGKVLRPRDNLNDLAIMSVVRSLEQRGFVYRPWEAHERYRARCVLKDDVPPRDRTYAITHAGREAR